MDITRYALAVTFVVSCKEPPIPTCPEVAAHAVDHIQARNLLSETDRAQMVVKLPLWDSKLGDADRAYIERQCAGWDVAYRRCVMTTRGDNVRCGDHDVEWWVLPGAKQWSDRVGELAGDAHMLALQASQASAAEVWRIEDEIDKAGTEAARAKLMPALAAAKQADEAAQALAKECGVYPLYKPACVALLERK